VSRTFLPGIRPETKIVIPDYPFAITSFKSGIAEAWWPELVK